MPPKPPTPDPSSLPSLFQTQWSSPTLDPTTLPFPRSNPPFPLTPTDWHQLSLSDADFTTHSWDDLCHIIAENRLEDLTRWPSSLKAYLAWTAHVKREYGSVMVYLLGQKLGWEPLVEGGGNGGDGKGKGELRFDVQDTRPFANPQDFTILPNDWPYALSPGISHIVVWLKQRLPVNPLDGALSAEGWSMVDEFVRREFRRKAGEVTEGEKVLWFKNTTDLQSVRSLEHVHVLVRWVEEGVLRGWMG